MDAFKRETVVDYTAWDLNCPQVVHRNDKAKLSKIFKRKARRNAKIELSKQLADVSVEIER